MRQIDHIKALRISRHRRKERSKLTAEFFGVLHILPMGRLQIPDTAIRIMVIRWDQQLVIPRNEFDSQTDVLRGYYMGEGDPVFATSKGYRTARSTNETD